MVIAFFAVALFNLGVGAAFFLLAADELLVEEDGDPEACGYEEGVAEDVAQAD